MLLHLITIITCGNIINISRHYAATITANCNNNYVIESDLQVI